MSMYKNTDRRPGGNRQGGQGGQRGGHGQGGQRGGHGQGGQRGGHGQGGQRGGRGGRQATTRTSIGTASVVLNHVPLDLNETKFIMYSIMMKGPSDEMLVNPKNVTWIQAFHRRVVTGKLHSHLTSLFGEGCYTYDQGAIVLVPSSVPKPDSTTLSTIFVIEKRRDNEEDVSYTLDLHETVDAGTNTIQEFELRYSHVMNMAIEKLVGLDHSVRRGGGRRVFYPAGESTLGKSLNRLIDLDDRAVTVDIQRLKPFEPRRGFEIAVKFLGCDAIVDDFDGVALVKALREGKFNASLTVLPKTGMYLPKEHAVLDLLKAMHPRGTERQWFGDDSEGVLKIMTFTRSKTFYPADASIRDFDRPIRFAHFGQPAGDIILDVEGAKMTLVQYFKKRYNKTISPSYPAFVQDEGPNGPRRLRSATYFPIESLRVSPQYVHTFNNVLQNNTTNVARIATDAFKSSVNIIVDAISNDPQATRALTAWGVGFKTKEMPKVYAYLPVDPEVMYAAGANAPVGDGKWDMRGMKFFGNVSTNSKILFVDLGHGKLGQFEDFVDFMSAQLKSALKQPLVSKPSVVRLENFEHLFADRQLVNKAIFRAKDRDYGVTASSQCLEFRDKFDAAVGNAVMKALGVSSLQAVGNAASVAFVVLPTRCPATLTDFVYQAVKALFTLEMDLPTQCLRADKTPLLNDRPENAQHYFNLIAGANIKTGSTNFIVKSANLRKIHEEGAIIFGCDLQHDRIGMKRVSTVGLMASVDYIGSHYVGTGAIQPFETDLVQDMTSLARVVLERRKAQISKPTAPRHLIYYRDGVDHGAHRQVEIHEVAPLVAAAKEVYPGADFKVTVILCLKRHQTRMLPTEVQMVSMGPQKRPVASNVPTGTIVGVSPPSKPFTVTSPSSKQLSFYINGHSAIPNSTAVPLRVCVTRNETGLSAFDLATFSYAIQHQDQVVTKSVSLPAPVMYSHKLCEHLKGQADYANMTTGRFMHGIPEYNAFAKKYTGQMSNLAKL